MPVPERTVYAACEDRDQVATVGGTRNRFAARNPSAMKANRVTPCAIANSGSDYDGAGAWRAGTF